MRRKGEKRIVHEPLVWSEDSTVARLIRTGDRWLFAWAFQQCARDIGKKAGVAPERLDDLYRGADPTDEELVKLAVPLRTDPGSLRASIEYGKIMKSVPIA